MSKTKVVTIRGHEFTIGWLTNRQYEKLVEELIEDQANPGSGKATTRRWRIAAESLQNASIADGRGAKGNPAWTEEILRAHMDSLVPGKEGVEIASELWGEVLEFNGLKTVKPGETPAAGSTLTPSAAA